MIRIVTLLLVAHLCVHVSSDNISDLELLSGSSSDGPVHNRTSRSVPAAPDNLVSYRGNNYKTYSFIVTGSASGSIWGTTVYTDDSNLATAAVHSGFVQTGVTSTIIVKIFPGRSEYTGSTHNGITSSSFGTFSGTYAIISATVAPSQPAPTNLVAFRGQNNNVFTFAVEGTAGGNVWGSTIYTDDSSLAAAAVHSGFVPPFKASTIVVKILPGQSSYTGSTKNGVSSQNYGAFAGSFSILSATVPPIPPAPENLSDYRGNTGQFFFFEIVGSTSGGVWGSTIYTDDSNLAAAAVHSGFVKPGEANTIMVKILPGESSYTGSTKNGVTSSNFGTFAGSYSILSVTVPKAPDAPANMAAYRGRNNEIFTFTLTGSTTGGVWGSGIYTDDSSLAAAAVHSGFVQPNVECAITIQILPGKVSYTGSTKHGVTSSNFGTFTGSYTIISATVEW